MKKRILLLLIIVFSLFMFSKKLNANTEDFVTINNGASIRIKTKTSDQGLRFTATLNESVKDKEHGFYLVFGETTVDELVEAINIGESQLIINGKQVFKVIVPGVSTDNEFSVVLIGTPEHGYLDGLTAIPYVKDGEAYHFSKAPLTRSIAEVAVSLKNAGYNHPSYDEIIDVVNETRRFVYDNQGNLNLTLGIIETNLRNLKKEFSKDWYQKFGVILDDFDAEGFYQEARKPLIVADEETNKNISETNLYKFFKELPGNYKWGWLLELLDEVCLDNQIIINQIEAINKGGVHPENNNLFNGKNLSYSIANFFNEANEGGNDNLDFTVENNYESLAIKNKNVIVNPNNYQSLYRKNDEIIVPEPVNNPPKGYKFKCYDLNGETINPGDTFIPTENNVIFKPQYETINYNVKFYDGSLELNSLETIYNVETQISFLIPEKEGYEFLGWHDNENLSGEPLVGLEIGNIGDLEFYAKWEAKRYSIFFSSDGGSLVNNLEYNFDETITAPTNITKEGYTFVGWIPKLPAKMPAMNLEVTAQWAAKEYTITFSGNGGSDATKTVVYGSEIGTLPTSTRKGYAFNGWFTAATSGTKITESTKPQGAKTYYAQWTIREYTIAFNINGGNWPKGEGEPGYTNRDVMITDFLTDFYNFVNPSENLTTFIHGSGKTSGFDGLYNESNYFTKLYDANVKGINASTGKFINQPEYNKWEPLLDLMDEYTGFNPDQTGHFWGSPVWVGIHRIKQFIQHQNLWNDVTNEQVTAVTTKIPHALTIGKPGPVITPPNKYKVTDEIILPIPLKSGSPFLGWYDNSNLTGTTITKIAKGSDGNKVFYAKWDDPTTFTVTYNLNGGAFTGYTSKTKLATDFLTDFYNFVGTTENLTTFIHGAGNSSGFNGTWYSNEEHRAKIFEINIKSGNNNYFLSSSSYQAKWKPFADFMVTFVKIGNPDQDFWSSPYTGNMRMWQYFRDVKPGDAWSDTDMASIPSGLAASVYYEYDTNSPTITLPKPSRNGFEFLGWYTANTGGTKVTSIPKGSTGNKTFYARWKEVTNPELVELMNYFTTQHKSSLTKKAITYYGWQSTSTHTLYPSVNRYLFNDKLSVNRNYMANSSHKSHPNAPLVGGRLEWVVVHDTGDNKGNASANARWVTNPSNTNASYHYTVGNDGWFQVLEEGRAAWHAGDGTSYAMFTNTGIRATNPALRPKMTTINGNFAINGTRTSVKAPAGSYPTHGLWPVIINGTYHIPDIRNRNGVLGYDGGNYSGIGIETAVNENTDVWLTWHRTAKLVADILVRNNMLLDRVVYHNSFTNKNCPQTATRAGFVPEWFKLMEAEYNLRKNYSNVTVTFASHSTTYLDNKGRIIRLPSTQTDVSYTITLKASNGATMSKRFSTTLRV